MKRYFYSGVFGFEDLSYEVDEVGYSDGGRWKSV